MGRTWTDSRNDLHEKRAAANFLNSPERNGGREYVDEGEDEGDEERVGYGASGLEEGGRVVENEVDARPLLHHLKRSTENGATDVAASYPKRAGEALEPAGKVTCGRDYFRFILGIGDDFSQFRSDVVRVLGLTAKSGEHGTSVLDTIFLDVVTGGLGKQVKANAEDQTPGKLDADGDTVRPGIGP